MLTKPVLFLIFNRLDTTKQVFEAIRQAKPPRLYIACDGPRQNKEGEAEKVQSVRDWVLANINWEVEVKTLFRDENLGCGKAVSGAITWFFDNEEDGIILEDDCLPHPTFFSYCEELLDKYKDNEQIMHIGSNHFLDFKYGNASYYFATIEHCWGWASWRRAWTKFDLFLEKYPLPVTQENLFNFYQKDIFRKYWGKIYEGVKVDIFDSWAYPWTLSIIANNGLCINPNVNLISNIGFGEEGTHTFGEDNPLANVPTYSLENIIHPDEIKRSQYIDEKIMEVHFGINDDNEQRIIQLEKEVNRFKRVFFLLKPIYRMAKKIKNLFRK